MRRREMTRHAAEAAALVRSGKVVAPKHRATAKQSDLFAAIGTTASMPEHIQPCKPTL